MREKKVRNFLAQGVSKKEVARLFAHRGLLGGISLDLPRKDESRGLDHETRYGPIKCRG